MIRDIQNIDDDISRKKRIVEKMLYSDPDIVELINDPEVDPSCPEDLMYSSIFPCLCIPDTQDLSKTFITYTLDDMNVNYNNEVMKDQQLQFVVFVHKDVIKTNYGVKIYYIT